MTKAAEIIYDPLTGKFWREAGCRCASGYRQIWFRGRQHMEHRLAWFLHHGVWPKEHIDHINGNRSDNRITNLRLASPSENACNRPKPRNNASGYKGVSWNSGNQRWQASVKFKGKNQFLGYYATREGAAAVYENAALRYQGEFAKLDL